MKDQKSREKVTQTQRKRRLGAIVFSKRALSLPLCAVLLLSLCAGTWIVFGSAEDSGVPDPKAALDALYAGGPFAQMTDETINRPVWMPDDSAPAGTEKQGGFIQRLSVKDARAERATQAKETAKTNRYLVKYKEASGGAAFKNTLSGRLDAAVAVSDGLEALTLNEALLPSELADELQAADAGRYIQYIQPDYLVSLQSLENTREEEEGPESSEEPEESPPASEEPSEEPGPETEEPFSAPPEAPSFAPEEEGEEPAPESRSVLIASWICSICKALKPLVVQHSLN